MVNPEQEARKEIDSQLETAGWAVQTRDEINLSAARGVAIREFPLKTGHGFVDYLLFVDEKAVGVLEAKAAGFPLGGVETQARKYSDGLPDNLDAPHRPLPFCYLATGKETRFINELDPKPRARRVFHFHRPETLAEWLAQPTRDAWVKSLLGRGGEFTAADDTAPSTLRGRLQTMPQSEIPGLWGKQGKAITNLELSLKEDRPRALVQMATGSGKTFMAVNAVYRWIKFAGARRVLFLVDRGNLAEQAETEFASFRTPDDHRKFDELYKVQRLQKGAIGASTSLVICTIQRLYSMLQGVAEYDEQSDIPSRFDEEGFRKDPLPVVYNQALPPEFFDFIIIDECHRSIYTLWRQVLEYFDAYLIGLTATPAKHTFGFFNQNLVMEYSHEEAVSDGVNVDFEIYRIRTKITAEGSTVEAGDGTMLGYRDRGTRAERWEKVDEDLTYTAPQLDRDVVARDQIRLIVKTFKEKLFTEIFPGRTNVPKTLIFAKDDNHAEDIRDIVLEEFGEDKQFCQKITYKVTGTDPKKLIRDFRNDFYPRVAITVDMIATGTDIQPVEIVLFLRTVKSRVLFEQMKGRGVRVCDPTKMKSATPDAEFKTHFVVVDCVGVTESEMSDTRPLERKKKVAFKELLEHVAFGGTDEDFCSSLASRLSRLNLQCGPLEARRMDTVAPGFTLDAVSRAIITALDPDTRVERARTEAGLPPEVVPAPEQIKAAGKALMKAAVAPLATNPALRKLLTELKRNFDQIIDEVSKDELVAAGFSQDALDKAHALVLKFHQFIEENRAEIDALQFFYSRPYGRRLRFKDIKALHDAIQAPPRSWTPEKIWAAYATIEASRVRGASAQRRLTDLVSLVRFSLERDPELVPFADQVNDRFHNWLAQQENSGRVFNTDQRRWLEMMRDHVAGSLEIGMDDFNYTPFVEAGGPGKAVQVFGAGLDGVIEELNQVLAG